MTEPKKRGRPRKGEIRADRNPDGPPIRSTARSDLARTEKALRLVYGAVLPRMHSGRIVGPFMARQSWQKAFVLNHAVFVQLAKELGESWMKLVRDAEAAQDDGRRVERRHMEDAAEEILAVVTAMPRPWQEVVVRRAAGMSWRQIGETLPDRVLFSMEDDYEAALRRVWEQAGDVVRRLI